MRRYIPEDRDHSYTNAIRTMHSDAQNFNELGRMIALFGPWGSGKTTFLDEFRDRVNERAAEKRLNGQRKVKVHYFDAWQHQYSSDFLLTMFAELLQPEVDPKKAWYSALLLEPEGKGILKSLFGLTGSLTNVVGRATGAGSVQEFVADYASFTGRLDELVDRQCKAHNEVRLAESLRRKTLDTISSYVLHAFGLDRSHGDRLIMIVDNLDRCDPQTLLSVLEFLEKTKPALKTSGLSGVHFLFPLDYEATKKAVRSRYAAFDSEDASAYVEKVFSPIYRMPRLDGQTVGKCLATDPDIVSTLNWMLKNHLLNDVRPEQFGDVTNLLLDGNPRKARHLVHATYQGLSRLPRPYLDAAHELGTRPTVMMIALLEFYEEFAELLIERRAAVQNVVSESDIHGMIGRARNEALALGRFADILEQQPQLYSVFSDLRQTKRNAAQFNEALGKCILLLQGLKRLGALQDR